MGRCLRRVRLVIFNNRVLLSYVSQLPLVLDLEGGRDWQQEIDGETHNVVVIE